MKTSFVGQDEDATVPGSALTLSFQTNSSLGFHSVSLFWETTLVTFSFFFWQEVFYNVKTHGEVERYTNSTSILDTIQILETQGSKTVMIC